MMNPEETKKPKSGSAIVRSIGILLPPLLIAAGIMAVVIMFANRPVPPKKPQEPMQGMVSAQPLTSGTHRVEIDAMGSVQPARQINLKARVAGEVVEVHPEFIEGGLIEKGAVLLRVDPVDYELALEQARANLVRAEYELQLEEGRQVVARREFELLGGSDRDGPANRDLALRVPHLKRVNAELKAARAELRKAEVNLERTVLRAPFDVIVLDRKVELGGQVRDQDTAAVLVDISEYWVGVSVPVDRLKWLTIPETRDGTGSEALVMPPSGDGQAYTGEVIRIEGGLEEQGRMARVIVRVLDPLGRDGGNKPSNRLLLNSFVRVHLHGAELNDVFRVPRAALREADQVWLVDKSGNLDIRTVRPVWRTQEVVLFKNGIHSGEKLITSDLAMPIRGMPLVVSE